MHRIIIALIFWLSAVSAGLADDKWPQRPLNWVVPFGPGGGADTVSRLIAANVSQALGKEVVVFNKPGGSSTIGTRQIAEAVPDGYTVGLLTDTHPVNVANGQIIPYDALKDFAYITQLIRVPLVLYTNGKRPELKALASLIAYAKKNPGKLTAASIGPTTPHHFAIEWFKALADLDIVVVPFRSIPEALQAIVAGHADMMFMGVGVAEDYANRGIINRIGVTSRQRMPANPDVKTFVEQGFPSFEMVSWYGLVAPAKTPTPLLKRWHELVTSALNDPKIRAMIEVTGAEPAPSTPEAYHELVVKEIDKYKKIVALIDERRKAK